MRLLTYQRWWSAVAIVTTLIFTMLWLSIPPTPKTYFQAPIPIPSHSNSRLLPFRYWNHRDLYPEAYKDMTCMEFPKLSDLRYAAATWQLLKVENGSVYVYGAYWDARFEEPVVRVLVYCDVQPVPKLYCQLWYPNDNEPQMELAEATYGWQPAWGGPTHGVNEPYILACRARRHSPEPPIPPVAVAVVTAPCGEATNVLNVQNAPFEDPLKFSPLPAAPPRNRTSIGVCVKWLHFRTDVSARVVEWLQLLQHMGADKAYLYIVRLHPNTWKVLDFYQDTGFAVVTEVAHPPQVSGVHHSRHVRDFLDMRRELLPLNDCLYRNLGRHDWLAVIDLDELIVPETDNSWQEMIARETATGDPVDALVFPNYYVLNDAQKDLMGPARARMLSHTWRARTPSPPGFYVKSFFNTSSVIAMHNHMPLVCAGHCNSRTCENSTGKLLHFREKCSDDGLECVALHDVVRDDMLKRWRATALKEMDEVLTGLGLE